MFSAVLGLFLALLGLSQTGVLTRLRGVWGDQPQVRTIYILDYIVRTDTTRIFVC